MRIGVVREIKPAERRVALTPAGALELAGPARVLNIKAGEITYASVAEAYARGRVVDPFQPVP